MTATPAQLEILKQNPPPKPTRPRFTGAALLCWGTFVALALASPTARQAPSSIASRLRLLESNAAVAAEAPREQGRSGPVAKTCTRDSDCGKTGRCVKGACQATAMEKKKQAAASPPTLHELMEAGKVKADIVPPPWQDQAVHVFESDDRRPGWSLTQGVFYPQER